jgi:CheY-like chemotaxis protein
MGTRSAPDTPQLCILLLEDHADTASAFGRLLRQCGHTVHIAKDCATARKEAASLERLDVLIADVGLPDGSGLDLLAELLADHSDLVGIAVSGHAETTDFETGQAAGFQAYLPKPISFERLRKVVDSVPSLRENRVRRSQTSD